MALVNGTTEFTLQYRLEDAVNKLTRQSKGFAPEIKTQPNMFECAGRSFSLAILVLSFKGNDWLGMDVISSKTRSDYVTASCTFRLLSPFVTRSVSKEFLQWTEEGDGDTGHAQGANGCTKVAKISEVLDPKNGFLGDGGAIAVEATVKITQIGDLVLPVTFPLSISFYEYSATKRSALDGPPSDFDVIANDGTRFGCHVFVLKNNPVFRKVYLKIEAEGKGDFSTSEKCDLTETKTHSVVLKEMSADVLRVVLSHIYHGSLKFDVSIAGDVLHAAETHDLPLLKRECEAVMAQCLKVENFLHYLMVAELTNAKQLKDACLLFWPKHGGDVMNTDDWDKFMRSKDEKNIVLTRNLFDVLLKENKAFAVKLEAEQIINKSNCFLFT